MVALKQRAKRNERRAESEEDEQKAQRSPRIELAI